MTVMSSPARATLEDSALLAALRSGDERAYEQLVRRHGGRLLAVARRLMRSEEEARDALQEAFVLAFRALPKFAGQSRLSTWLHRIVVNAALMRLRARRSRPEEPLEPLLPAFQEDGHTVRRYATWSADPEQLAGRAEVRRSVREPSIGCRRATARYSCSATSRSSTPRRSPSGSASPPTP